MHIRFICIYSLHTGVNNQTFIGWVCPCSEYRLLIKKVQYFKNNNIVKLNTRNQSTYIQTKNRSFFSTGEEYTFSRSFG